MVSELFSRPFGATLWCVCVNVLLRVVVSIFYLGCVMDSSNPCWNAAQQAQ